ncbi:hypothetical protein RI129_008544 [Pyrocoelia pectoralis]|uniref:Sulfhydryl oxidase n=1 Tax=Pyrocoelia pectoralis TaxID=417401 RepID=A0AAN7ZG43_9COLE
MHRGSPLDNEKCRSCTSFSDYFKSTKAKLKTEQSASELSNTSPDEVMDKPLRTDCPLDKDELGNATWSLLHTMATKFPKRPNDEQKRDMTQFFNLLGKFYPCEQCADDFRKDLKADPPNVENGTALSQWLCRLHNKVNVKLDKPEFDCSKVNERWRDGWLDGSCDF